MPAIYKAGQGYWVRLMSAYAIGALMALGLVWLWKELDGMTMFGLEPTYVQVGFMLIAAVICGIIGWYLLGVHRGTVEFMVATEGEMRKVNWSTRQEISAATKVVILLTLFTALYCWAFDIGFASIFRWMTVLRAG
ncbi:MAG: preprotein translocase subunit SecE [Phycisphaerales bacterium]|nr:preprotein translocase subunit SecE [Phycisphaerales bacterium]